MERKSLEELGLEKEIVNKVLDMHNTDIGDLKKQYIYDNAGSVGFEISKVT